VVPAGTPAALVERLNRDINTVLAQPEVKKIFEQQGVVPEGGTPEQFKSFIASQMALWKRVVVQGRITAE